MNSCLVTQNFTKVPQPSHTLYGSNAVFDCISGGEPTPRVEWQIKLNKLENTVVVDKSYKDKYIILTNGSLYVKQVLIDDEGDYICVSYSPGLIKTVSTSLTVYGMLLLLLLIIIIYPG